MSPELWGVCTLLLCVALACLPHPSGREWWGL